MISSQLLHFTSQCARADENRHYPRHWVHPCDWEEGRFAKAEGTWFFQNPLCMDLTKQGLVGASCMGLWGHRETQLGPLAWGRHPGRQARRHSSPGAQGKRLAQDAKGHIVVTIFKCFPCIHLKILPDSESQTLKGLTCLGQLPSCPRFSLSILGPHSRQALGWGLPESPLMCSCKLTYGRVRSVHRQNGPNLKPDA